MPRAVHAVNRADLVAVLDDLLPADRLADLLGAPAMDPASRAAMLERLMALSRT